MKTLLLSSLLALGLPGASACSAQQGALPRIGQEPAATASGGTTTPAAKADDEEDDADNDADEMESETDELEASDIAELPELKVLTGLQPLQQLFGVQAQAPGCCEGSKAEAQAKCEAGCAPKAEGQGTVQYSITTSNDPLALGGTQVLRLNEKDLKQNGKCLTIQPGQTVVLDTKNGKQVVLRAQSPSSISAGSLNGTLRAEGMPFLTYARAGQAAAAPRSSQGGEQDLEQRVRQLEERLRQHDQGQREDKSERERALEQRVRELERQLERQHATPAPAPPKALFEKLHGLGYTGSGEKSKFKLSEPSQEALERYQVEAEAGRELAQHHRELAEELRAHAEAQRDQAQQQRDQAQVQRDQAREQGDALRKHAREMESQARAYADRSAPRRRFVAVPAPAAAPEPVAPPAAPEAAMPAIPGGAWWPRTPTPPRAVAAPRAPADRAEVHKLLEDMRAQMAEMRKQVEALRSELEQAPQHQDH